MRCVILQPSYIPWRGYFDLIRKADVFIFYDDVQYDKHGWRNRNRIKTPQGSRWLTIPVRSRGAISGHVPIDQVSMSSEEWAGEHLATLQRVYGAAPYFDLYRQWLDQTYADPPRMLAEFTIASTIGLASLLGITTTRFLRSSQFAVSGKKTDRLIELLRQVGATHYLSGPSARDYLEPQKFADAGVTLEWMAYDYPEYPQLYPPFDPQVSVLDLLFMTGPDAPRFIWSSP